MELSKRHLNIMSYLRECQDYVTIEALSERYGVSERTIRSNLDKIEKYMVSNGLPYLDRERIKGVRLVPSAQTYDFIDQCAGKLRRFQYNYSAEERQAFLRLKLLLAPHHIRTEDLCQRLDRSRNTIYNDLEATEEWLNQNDIQLIRRPHIGLYCVGEEVNRRNLITQIIME